MCLFFCFAAVDALQQCLATAAGTRAPCAHPLFAVWMRVDGWMWAGVPVPAVHSLAEGCDGAAAWLHFGLWVVCGVWWLSLRVVVAVVVDDVVECGSRRCASWWLWVLLLSQHVL